jgi:hypothetical protein
MDRLYNLRPVDSSTYGRIMRVDFDRLSFEELKGLLKDIQFSVLSFGHSDDGKPAFLEFLVSSNDGAVERRLHEWFNGIGYREKV